MLPQEPQDDALTARVAEYERVHGRRPAQLLQGLPTVHLPRARQGREAVGPLVNAEGRDKVIELVDDAVGKVRKDARSGLNQRLR